RAVILSFMRLLSRRMGNSVFKPAARALRVLFSDGVKLSQRLAPKTADINSIAADFVSRRFCCCVKDGFLCFSMVFVFKVPNSIIVLRVKTLYVFYFKYLFCLLIIKGSPEHKRKNDDKKKANYKYNHFAFLLRNPFTCFSKGIIQYPINLSDFLF